MEQGPLSPHARPQQTASATSHPVTIRCPLALLLGLVRSLGTNHARGCQTDTDLALGPEEGGQAQREQGPGMESGHQRARPFKQRLSPGGLNLATGSSARKGGWSQVTLGQQRGPWIPGPQHLLTGHVHSTPPPSKPSQAFKPFCPQLAKLARPGLQTAGGEWIPSSTSCGAGGLFPPRAQDLPTSLFSTPHPAPNIPWAQAGKRSPWLWGRPARPRMGRDFRPHVPLSARGWRR